MDETTLPPNIRQAYLPPNTKVTRFCIDQEGKTAKIKRKLLLTLENTNDNFKREFNNLEKAEEPKRHLDIKKIFYFQLTEGTARRVIQDKESNLVYRNFLKDRISRFRRPEQKIIKDIILNSLEDSEQLSIQFLHRIISDRLFELNVRHDLNIPNNKCIFSHEYRPENGYFTYNSENSNRLLPS